MQMWSQPAWFIPLAAVLGLIVGSFLNVVIHRLPLMLQREWRRQCHEYLGETGTTVAPVPEGERYDLLVPRSRCPRCGHAIGAAENIPVISYMIQRGRCRGCGGKISARYPVVETVTAALSAVVAWHFGWGFAAGAALLLTWALIALSVIDLDHQILPDNITLPVLWLGLLLSLGGTFTDPRASVLGAVAGYLSLWTVYQVFKIATGKEGMGYGDFKLLAMLGAWLGWQFLPAIILLSSVVGAIVGITLVLIRGRDKNIPIPFGPYLAAAGWLTLLWGEDINRFYLAAVGLS